MYRSAFVFSTVFIVLLSIPGSVSSASVTLRPVARLRGGSGELFGELGYDGIVAPPAGGKSLRVRSLDGPDTYLLVESLGCGRGRVLLAARDPAPTRFAIEWAESRHVVSVDWSTAAVDRDLPAAWAAAARRHFNELSRQGELRPWARFALERLSVRDLAATPRGFPGAQGIRRTPHSAFELTTGAVAIEESLQLERLRGVGWGRRRDRPQDETIRVSSIPGVTIRSHPWSEMLAGRDPLPHAIERFLPLDQYSFEARSFRALIDLADWTDAIGSPAVEWLEDRADDSGVKARLERQLCLPTSVVARRLGPLVIRRVAATGRDPFLREGADFTLVFELSTAPLFFANLEKNRLAAATALPTARRVEVEHRTHAVRGLVSPDRAISSYSVHVDGFGLVSNSLVGLKRVLDAYDGEIPSQDEGLDRKFVRTQLARSHEEDAFLFLSDPAIRHIVSPGLKLRERRRLECSASLRSISHATAWRHARGARGATALTDLITDDDLSSRMLFCPDRGEYRLRDDHRSGACSIHGHLDFLTPNVELDLELVTLEEKQAYDRFRDTYQRYWSRFFDPIGMQMSSRVDADGRRSRRFDTVILPLLEMTEYRQMQDLFGGESAQSGLLPEAVDDTTLLATAHLNRDGQLFSSGQGLLVGQSKALTLGWIGDRVSLFVRDAPKGTELKTHSGLPEDLLEKLVDGYPGGIRIDVENKLLLAGFLAAVRGQVELSAPGTVQFETLPPRHGVSVVSVSPAEEGSVRGPEAIHYAVIGDGLFVSLDRGTLEAVIDSEHERKASPSTTNDASKAVDGSLRSKPVDKPATSWIDGSHVALDLDLSGSPTWRGILVEMRRAVGHQACRESRRRVERMRSLGLDTPGAFRSFRGSLPCCPLGGQFTADARGALVCSHEAPVASDDNTAPAGTVLERLDGLRATLRFTADGVRTVVEVHERPPNS